MSKKLYATWAGVAVLVLVLSLSLIGVAAAARPGAPTNLAGTVVSTTSIHLTWTNPVGSLTGDNVTLYSAGCAGVLHTYVTTGVVTSYTVTTLTAGTSYCLTVDASTATGQGVNATPYLNLTTDPSPPTALAVTSVSTTVINLAWTAPSGPIVNSTVRYGTTNGVWPSWQSVGGAATTIQIGSLIPGTTYYFSVEAWTTGGNSTWTTSSVTGTTTPAGGGGSPCATDPTLPICSQQNSTSSNSTTTPLYPPNGPYFAYPAFSPVWLLVQNLLGLVGLVAGVVLLVYGRFIIGPIALIVGLILLFMVL